MKTDKSIYYPQAMRIPANRIKVPRDAYQRNAQTQKINKICDDYNKYLVNRVKVYQSMGSYWAFDGQNTLVALTKLFGNDCEVPCDVYEIDDVTAAELFELQSGYSSRPTSRDKFKSKKFRQDEDTNKIISICESYGFKVDPHGTTTPMNIRYVADLDTYYKKLGKYEFEKIIRVISNCWLGEKYCNYNGLFLGIAQFLEKFGDKVDEARLKKKLSKVSSEFLYKRIKEHGKEYGANRYIVPILDEYNKGYFEKSRLHI